MDRNRRAIAAGDKVRKQPWHIQTADPREFCAIAGSAGSWKAARRRGERQHLHQHDRGAVGGAQCSEPWQPDRRHAKGLRGSLTAGLAGTVWAGVQPGLPP
jgi:hypothetical protein